MALDPMSEPLTGRTPQGSDADLWRVKFVAALREHGNVSTACRAVGRSRTQAYHHRKNDPVLARLWDDVVEATTDRLEETLMNRALDGYEEWTESAEGDREVRHKVDNGLSMRLLAAQRRSKYGDRQEIELKGEITTKRVVFGGSEGGDDGDDG